MNTDRLIEEKLHLIRQYAEIIDNFNLTPPEKARVNSAFVLLKNLIADRMKNG